MNSRTVVESILVIRELPEKDETGLSHVLFNKRTGVFYRGLNHEAKSSGFRCDKTRHASLLNGLKTFYKKRVSLNSIQWCKM